MSTVPGEDPTDSIAEQLLSYVDPSNPDRYVDFAREILSLRVAQTQARLLRALANHQRVLIISGNGVGKSYGVAAGILGFLFSNPDSIALLTSGSYSMLTDTTWRPMRELHKDAQERLGLPGKRLDNPPRLETNLSDEWYFKAVSPTYPDNLEGRHAGTMLVVIEEADKPDITEQHFDSAGSSITDASDRMVAVANPPRDESNIVYEKMQSDRWHTVQFSTFDSHNVMVDAGEYDAPKIPGLTDLDTVRDDYVAWNGEDWPGYEQAQAYREGLDSRWYRRRLGRIPPDDAQVPRPFSVADVELAVDRYRQGGYADPIHRQALGVDIARGGGDRTAIAEIRGDVLEITAEKDTPGDHAVNEQLVSERIEVTGLNGPVAMDAVGEGSGVADTIRRQYPKVDVTRFNAGSNAGDSENYYDARTEALQMLGEFLRERGAVAPESTLARELRAAARAIEYEEKTLRANSVWKATSKDILKEPAHLGRSPDALDAASLAAWAEGGKGKSTAVVGSWGSSL